MNYFITTEHIGFRIWDENDLHLAKLLWGDSEVTRYIGGPFSNEQIKARFLKEISNYGLYEFQYWPIFLMNNDIFLGCCGLRPYDLEKKILEIGFHLRPCFWGHGYAKEAARAVISFAFDTLEISSLFAGHHPGNDASHRLLIQLGFCYVGDEYYPPTGLNHPSYILIASDFNNSIK